VKSGEHIPELDRWLQALSLAVADGNTEAWPEPDGAPAEAAPLARHLKQLGRLRQLFRLRAAAGLANLPDCPFQWSRLEVQQKIGSGSFSEVFRARDPVLDREVALKLFRDTESDPRELISEARRHARVHHPRVLAIHGADIDGGLAGLWTDLLEGSTLQARVAESGPLPPAALRQLAGDLAEGLQAVHEQGILHGDLKPENVWIDRSDHGVLMDFGASVRDSEGKPARYGSPAAMAPELFEGAPPSRASDVWGLGVVLYFAATARYPYAQTCYADLQGAHRSGASMDVAALNKKAGALRPLIENLLNPAPAERPLPVDIASALRHLDQAPARRLRRGAAASVIAALSVGIAVSLFMLDRAESARAAAERARFEAQTSKDFLIESVRRMSPESERGLGSVRAVLEFLAEFGERELGQTPLPLGELEVVVGTRLTHFDAEGQGFELARRGIARIEQVAPNARHELARAYNLLANAQRQRGLYLEAQANARIALEHIEALPETDQTRYQAVQIRGMLVALLGDLGAWHEALLRQRQQLAERAALVGEEDPRMAVEYNNLADPLWRVGRLDEALAAYRKSLQLLRAASTPRPFPEAGVTAGIAHVLMLQGRSQAARERLDEARDRFRALGLSPEHPSLRALDIRQASLLRRNGRADSAIAELEALLDDALLDRELRRDALIELGIACLEARCAGKALASFESAAEAALPGSHPDPQFLGAAREVAAYRSGKVDLQTAQRALADAMRWYADAGYGGSDRHADMQRWLQALAVSET
jgi:tetratricopeptide (TPR) repeat protein